LIIAELICQTNKQADWHLSISQKKPEAIV
jgi:hypothetical protein